MPHLTGRGLRPSDAAARAAAWSGAWAPGWRFPTGAARTAGLGVPDLAHPLLAPAEWAELARPGLPLRWVVLNPPYPEEGPGGRPDPHSATAAARVREAGVPLLGRLDLRDGARTFGELASEAHRFLDWYAVDGFYLAHCPADLAGLDEVARVVATLRALTDGGRTVLDHGCTPHPGYTECGDELVVFAGPWSAYRWLQTAEWTAAYPAERFCHRVHGVPHSHLREALRLARWHGAGTVCCTDRTADRGRDPWSGLPGYWDELVSHLGPDGSE